MTPAEESASAEAKAAEDAKREQEELAAINKRIADLEASEERMSSPSFPGAAGNEPTPPSTASTIGPTPQPPQTAVHPGQLLREDSEDIPTFDFTTDAAAGAVPSACAIRTQDAVQPAHLLPPALDTPSPPPPAYEQAAPAQHSLGTGVGPGGVTTNGSGAASFPVVFRQDSESGNAQSILPPPPPPEAQSNTEMVRQLKSLGYSPKDIDIVISILGPDSQVACEALILMNQLRS